MSNIFDISVIICSYNRCESLKDTLDSLLNQECDGSFDYEVIVVDNNSKDKTRLVVESYISKFNGRLKYIFEPKQGLSYARNRGIKESKGEIVTFTEDDVIIDKKWLCSIYSSFVNYDCDVSFGKILLRWYTKPPPWLTKRFYGNLGLLNRGDDFLRIESDDYGFFGGNFSVKKAVFREIGNFNTLLGRRGYDLVSGEDTELFFRLLSANKRIYYQPRSIVYHKVENKKINKSYFRRLNFGAGQLTFSIHSKLYRDKNKKYLFGVPYWLYVRLLKLFFRHVKRIFFEYKAPDERFEWELVIFHHLGIMSKAYQTRRYSEEIAFNDSMVKICQK